ncbi:MAG: hypothetical protein WBB28_01760 [Crinalium sp.]
MSSGKYQRYYELQELLSQESRVIPAPPLYSHSIDEIVAAQMYRAAQPLPNGDPSPLTSQFPGSVHAILFGALAHQLELFAHELNLIPDRAWVQILQLLGVELMPDEYSVLTLRFTRSGYATTNNIPIDIPLGTEVLSNFRSQLSAYTLQSVSIEADDEFVDVSARLSQTGDSFDIRSDEFTQVSRGLSSLLEVTNLEQVSAGRRAETMAEAALRTRKGIRTGSLGRFYKNGVIDFEDEEFLGRAMNASDYAIYAEQLGAKKVAVLPGLQIGVEGTFGDLVTLAIYPDDKKDQIASAMKPLILVGTRLSVIAAEIIPITGTITVRVLPNLTDAQVRDIAAQAIVDKINPPHGQWGDLQFESHLAAALEEALGIIAVPAIALVDELTGLNLSSTKINPWSLLEIQDSINFIIKR